MENFTSSTQLISICRNAYRHQHKLLQSQAGITVHTAVQNIEHRHWHLTLSDLQTRKFAQVLIQRHFLLNCCCPRHSQRYAQDGIRAQATLVFRTIQINHFLIEFRLLSSFHPNHCLGNFGIHILYSLQNTLALVTLDIPIAQLYCFKSTSRSSRRHHSRSTNLTLQFDSHFHSRIAPRIQNFPPHHLYNL